MQGNQVNAFNCYHSAVIVNHETKRLFKSDQIWNQRGFEPTLRLLTENVYYEVTTLPTLPSYC